MRLTIVSETVQMTLKRRSCWERSSRLPEKKKFSFIFCPWKGFRTYVSKIVWLFSNSLFSCRREPKLVFAQIPRVNKDLKCRFHSFCQGCCDCSSIAHAISLATSSTIYLISSQTKYGNFTWNSIHISVIRRDPSTLICKSKIHQFIGNNSRNAGVNFLLCWSC